MIINFMNGGASGGGVKSVDKLPVTANTGTMLYDESENGLYIADGQRQECYNSWAEETRYLNWDDTSEDKFILNEGYYEEGINLGTLQYTIPFIQVEDWVDFEGDAVPEGVEAKTVRVDVVNEGTYLFHYDNHELYIGLDFSGGSWSVFNGLNDLGNDTWEITNGAQGTVTFDGSHLIAEITDDTYYWNWVDAYGVGGQRAYFAGNYDKVYSINATYESGNTRITDSEGFELPIAYDADEVENYAEYREKMEVEGYVLSANTQDIKDTLDSGGSVSFVFNNDTMSGYFKPVDDDDDPTTPDIYQLVWSDGYENIDDLSGDEGNILSGEYGNAVFAAWRVIEYDENDPSVVVSDVIYLASNENADLSYESPLTTGGTVTLYPEFVLGFAVSAGHNDNLPYIRFEKYGYGGDDIQFEEIGLVDYSTNIWVDTATTCDDKTDFEQVITYRAASDDEIQARNNKAGDAFSVLSAETITDAYTGNTSASTMTKWNKSVELAVESNDSAATGHTQFSFHNTVTNDRIYTKIQISGGNGNYTLKVLVGSATTSFEEVCSGAFDFSDPEAWECNSKTYIFPKDFFIGGITITPSISYDSGNNKIYYSVRFECDDNLCIVNGKAIDSPLSDYNVAFRNPSRLGLFRQQQFYSNYTKYANVFGGELGIIEKDGDTAATKYNLASFVSADDIQNCVMSTDIRNMVKIEQSAYDALVSGGTVDETTFYVIVPDSNNP